MQEIIELLNGVYSSRLYFVTEYMEQLDTVGTRANKAFTENANVQNLIPYWLKETDLQGAFYCFTGFSTCYEFS